MKAYVLAAALLLGLAQPALADSEDNYNAYFSPVGLIIGISNVGMDFKVSDQFVVGPYLTYWRLNWGDVEASAFGIGGHGEYFFNGAFTDSPVIDFSLGYLNFGIKDSDDDTGTSEEAKESAMVGNVLAGYHWFFGSSFNMALSGGLGFNTLGEAQVKDENGNVVREEDVPSISFAARFDLGWTF